MSNTPIQDKDVKVPVDGYLSPGTSDLNTWATHKAQFGQGGFEVVDTAADRDAITDDRKLDKMVYVRDNKSFYENKNGVWTTAPLGANSGTLTVADKDTTVNDVTHLELQSMGVVETGLGDATLEPFTTFSMQGDEQFGAEANKVTLISPLQGFADPNNPMSYIMELKHGVYEPLQAPGYLAYIQNDTTLIGKETNELAHYNGAIWPMDVVHSGSSYIISNPSHKSISIQEADELDPNVTGGTDYLVAFRIHMEGVAPEDGSVRIYLAKKANFGEAGEMLTDVNGSPLSAKKVYKQGDELGSLEVFGVVNAKGLKEFTMHVVDNFQSDIVIADRAKGVSGIMVQAIKSDNKTGSSLMQYEIDTQQNIEFTKHYLGEDIMSLGWVKQYNYPMTLGAANKGAVFPDGLSMYNLSPMKLGVQGGVVNFQDDGSSVCDFYFGKVFNSLETRALRGKEVKAYVNLVDKDSGWNVGLVKYTGKADAYGKVYTSRDGSGAPVWGTDWTLVDTLFIAEDTYFGEHIVNKTFTVPNDAENYGLIIYPVQAQQPMTLKLKNFKLDVSVPFNYYELHKSVQLNEIHLKESKEFLETIQDNQEFASLRYTIGDVADGVPMPCGKTHSGRADITLDTSVNQVVGSGASGGEGALKFMADGEATVNTVLRIWSEQPKGTTSTVKFWWVSFGPDGTAQPIPDSETTFSIPGGSEAVYTMQPFDLQVSVGDRIGLRAQADKADGAYIKSTTSTKPMVDVKINFQELLADTADDPWGALNLSQFDTVYDHSLSASVEVKNASVATFNINIPDGMFLEVKRAIMKLTDGSLRPIQTLDYMYKDGVLKVSFGQTVADAKVLIGVYR